MSYPMTPAMWATYAQEAREHLRRATHVCTRCDVLFAGTVCWMCGREANVKPQSAPGTCSAHTQKPSDRPTIQVCGLTVYADKA